VTDRRWADYEDAELVIETLAGEAAAFDGLVERYRAAVLATVLRQVPSRAVAEEICQEALVRSFRALPRLRNPQRFAAWLHAIARREVIRHGPAESRAADYTPLDEQLLEHGEAVGESGWERVERREEGEAVRQAMAGLPEEFQLVLTLYYWADLSVEQIARYIGRPITTVKWRLHRARALMRQRLTAASEIPDNTWRSPDDTTSQRQRDRAAPHREDAREDGRDGTGRRDDRQPGGAQRGRSAQLQRDGEAPDQPGADLDGALCAVAG